MQPFVHSRIPATGWLRLLTINTNGSSTLRCGLNSYGFANTPKYYALSYHWGNSQDRLALECDGGELQISPTLYRALLHLQKYSEGGSISHFWIDQICINQDDTHERTDQVLQMGKIYQRSERTLIWLEMLGHQSSHRVFDLLEQITKARQVPRSTVPQIYAGRITKEENQELNLPDFTSSLWVELGEFMENPWFQRAWIVQEAALSKTSPLILCQDVSIDFTAFLTAIRWLESRGYTLVTGCIRIPATPTLISSIRDHTNPRSGALCSWKLEAMLRTASDLRSSDPRDRIYAVLGMTAHEENLRNGEQALLPDYRRDVVELYCSVTRYCIQESKRLSILGSGGVAVSTVEGVSVSACSFPSWVPRWDRPRHDGIRLSGPHRLYPAVDQTSRVDITDIMPYDAADGTYPLVGDSGDHSELVLGGLLVDSISWSSDVIEREDFGGYIRSPVRQLWERALSHVGLSVDPESRRFQDFAASFYMAFISGLDSRNPGKFGSTSSIKHFWRYLTLCYEAIESESGKTESNVEIYRSLGMDGDQRNVQTHLPGRKFFVTRGGRVGSGAATLRTDDEVYVLFGGSMPYVLRERDETHEMIGEVYVHGLMKGEAITEYAKGTTEPRWVTLR